MTLWYFQDARRFISNKSDNTRRYITMLASLSYWKILIFLKHREVPRLRHSPWTIGSLTTHHRCNSWVESTDEYFGDSIDAGPLYRHSSLCTLLRAYCCTAKEKAMKSSTDSVWKSRRRQATCLTNTARVPYYTTIIGSSQVHRHLNFGHLCM